MNLPKIAAFSLLLGVALTLPLTGADEVQLEGAKVGQWTMDYDAAVTLAAEKKLPMMLNFTGSDWCGWCKLMDKNVFAQEEWKSYAAANVVLVTIDFPQDKSIVPEKFVDRNAQLQQKFGVGGYPTYVLLESDGKTVLGQLSAGKEKTPTSFIREIKTAVLQSESGTAAYLKLHPEQADALKKAVSDSKAATKALTDWIATGPEQNETNNQKFAALKERIAKAEAALADFN
jgi:thioredoxin-related protein